MRGFFTEVRQIYNKFQIAHFHLFHSFKSRSTEFSNQIPQSDSIPLSRMCEKGRLAEVHVKQWILFILSFFLISFPPPSLAVKTCAEGADRSEIKISYSLRDEFGEETSVAWIGGTLVIGCKNDGSKPCTSSEKDVPNTKEEDGTFVIKIVREVLEVVASGIRCCCGAKDQIASSDYAVRLNEVLCSPSLNQDCPPTQLCHLKSDGTTGCTAEKDVQFCPKTSASQLPASKYLLCGISSKNAIPCMKYCKSLEKEENVKQWGQFEIKEDVDFFTFLSKFAYRTEFASYFS